MITIYYKVRTVWTMRIVTLLFTLYYSLFLTPGFAQLAREYTEEQPLIIVSDWEFPPYEFSNDKGEPDGYNVEVLNLILGRLKIPHRFVMKEWYQCTEAFNNHEADLIHALAMFYKEKPYVMTSNLITYYRIKAVRRESAPPIPSLTQLSDSDTLTVKNNDYVPLEISLHYPNHHFAVEYHSPREAIAGVHSGKYKYFLWGEQPINWKIKELSLDSLTTDDTDIPPGELRFIGYDKTLINMIDDEFARLDQAGQITKLRDKWFHPERVHNDSSPIALFFIVGAAIIALVALILSRLIRLRVQAAVNKSVDLNYMMTQAVDLGNYFVFVHDLSTDMMSNVYGILLPPSGMTYDEFESRIHPDYLQGTRHNKDKLLDNSMAEETKLYWNVGTPAQPRWRCLHGKSITEREDGKPRYIVNAFKDVTQEIEEERENSELGEKYMKIFETNLIAMSFYDSDGRLINLNEKMRRLCEFNDENEKYFRQTRLFDISLIRGEFNPDSREEMHVCQRMFFPELGLKKYIEMRIKPIIGDDGHIIFYSVTSRDITDERTMYLEQLSHDKEMHKINDEVNLYERQLQYLLENSRMFVWNINLQTLEINFSRSLKKKEFSMSRADYIKGMAEDEHEDADRNLMEVMMKGMEFNTVHYFNYTPANPEPCWYALSGIPTRDAQGRLTGYFGIARDITDLVEAQQKLKRETARAEDSGRLKSAFLANMTHEIRTPLNAIVGFSDLLPVIDTTEERMEFIRIIRNNCDMLLRLINDILEASSMGQALAIEPTEVEFAQVFDDICQTLAQRVQEPGVEFIKDNPYTAYSTIIDKGRVQQVLTNFVTNAVKYTHQGHIKVGYRQETRDGKDGLYLYCEDTGVGIPQEKQASVFERFVKLNDFVQGTGLGLSICKAIAERCHGEIGVSSEGEGHGSTFWLWIPCEKVEK